MKNITLAIDEKIIEAGRAYAIRHHTTLNQLVRDLLEKTVTPERQGAIEAFLRTTENSSLRLDGWRWDREEAYRGRI